MAIGYIAESMMCKGLGSDTFHEQVTECGPSTKAGCLNVGSSVSSIFCGQNANAFVSFMD